MALSRRNLLLGASTGAFMATIAPNARVALARDAGAARDILIVLFLRGGSDGLQMIAPSGDSNYISKRPTIAVPSSGTNAGIGLGTLDGVDFYLNPSVPELKSLYDAEQLAVVHATGMEMDDRSHFECQEHMERGVNHTSSHEKRGWLTRHIESLSEDRPALSTVSSSGDVPNSLLKYPQAVSIYDVKNFKLRGSEFMSEAVRSVNIGDSAYKTLATRTLDAIASVEAGLQNESSETAEGAQYPGGELAAGLRSLARLIKMDVGIDIATVDHGGWDQHDNLEGEFRNQAEELSRSLAAFWTDIADYQDRVTVVTMTEFGRRLEENGNRGTDHGMASYMFLLGGNVNGGKIYGDWPGLDESDLVFGDLAVTTDYRRVLSEILVKRHFNPRPHDVFPSTAYEPLGIVQGDDSTVVTEAATPH
jgi:uncharacterized protein (DUF1501 family)